MKNLSIIFVALIFVACSNRSGFPADIIPVDSMTLIMKDVVMANEYSMAFISKDSLNKDKYLANQQLLDSVFRLHHITRELFQNSLRFYDSRPDKNKLIFDSLAAYGNRNRNALYRPLKIPKAIAPVAK